MSNYASHSSAELIAIATDRVHQEWLVTAGPRFATMMRSLRAAAEKRRSVVFLPEPALILEPLRWMGPSDVKVVILGQSPYHNPGEPCGVAFQSFADRIPFSAKKLNANLIKYGHIPESSRGCSVYQTWLKQGVLLLNTVLTTEQFSDDAHAWMWDCSGVVSNLLGQVTPRSVAILLGKAARNHQSELRCSVKIIHSHPAAPSQPFEDKDVFGEANSALTAMGLTPIDWTPGPATP